MLIGKGRGRLEVGGHQNFLSTRLMGTSLLPATQVSSFHGGFQFEGLASLPPQLGHSKGVAEQLGREQKVNVKTSHPEGSLQGCCTNSWAQLRYRRWA